MSYEPTVISSWVSVSLHAFSTRGVNPELACKKSNITKDQLKNPFTPIPLSKIIILWDYAESIIQSKTFGLETARLINFTTFHSLGYAVLASASLYDAFIRITDYSNAASNMGYTFLVEENDRFVFGIKVNPEANSLPDGCVDMTLAIFRFMCRLIHDEKPQIIKLEMARNEIHDIETFKKIFCSNIALDCEHYAIHFTKPYLLKPIPTANESVAIANDKFVEELISKTQNQSASYQTRKVIRSNLLNGEPVSIENIAKVVNMSERNLQRHLHQEKTTFRTLIDHERKKLARQLLQDSKESICNIAYQLGFSDSANFSRAFRRWFDCKPMNFREKKDWV